MPFFETIFVNLQQWAWAPLLLSRIAIGVFFALTGWGKISSTQGIQKMQETMREAGVPFPDFNGIFVSWVEFIFGVLLAIGLLTPLACLMLLAVMVVATLTVKVKGIEADSASDWLTEFLSTTDVLYVLLLLWIFFTGPGPLSLDGLFFI